MSPGPDSERLPDPPEPRATEAPLLDRRTLLQLGGALTVALATGGGVDLILHTISSPAAAAKRPISIADDLRALDVLPARHTSPTSPAPHPASSATDGAVPGTTTTTPAPSQDGLAPTPPSGGTPAKVAPTKYFGSSADRHVYITIDDGYFPDNRVIDVMRSEQVPITTFLITEAAAEHLGFWRSFVTAGGQIQNHTYSHPYLTGLSKGDAEGQWARANKAYKGWFGTAPVIGRPPYGAINHTVAVAAREAGLDSMIMWSALDQGSGIQTWNNGPIAPGSIILLHWTPGLYADLLAVLQDVSDHHLVPAFLTEA